MIVINVAASDLRFDVEMQGYREPMLEGYILQPLSVGQIAQAYPLVQAAMRETSLARWSHYARHLIAGEVSSRCGIMTVQTAGGYIHGLFAYRALETLEYGRTLFVRDFIALDPAGGESGATILIAAIDATARQNDCVAVHVQIPEYLGYLRQSGKPSLTQVLNEMHYRLDQLGMSRKLPNADIGVAGNGGKS